MLLSTDKRLKMSSQGVQKNHFDFGPNIYVSKRLQEWNRQGFTLSGGSIL